MRSYVAIALLAVGACLTAGSAHADYILNFSQQGSNVVATGSGSFDASVLEYIGDYTAAGGVEPNNDHVVTGLPSEGSGYDVNVVGPSSFGSGPGGDATVGTGDIVGLVAGSDLLILPLNYVAKTLLNDTATYDNSTFASLGLTPGKYVFDLTSVAFGPKGAAAMPADVFTIVVPAAATVPEPSSIAIFCLGLTGLAGWSLRRARANRFGG